MTMLNRRILMALSAAAIGAQTLPALAQTRNPSRIRVALLPDENAATIIQNAEPLRLHLEKVLARSVELVVTTDYSSMIEAARFGRIEIAYFGPLSYVLAKSRAPELEPFAVGIERGSPTYNGVLIAQAGGLVAKVEDIKGKSFAFGDQASTSSHLIPRAFLANRDLIAGRDYQAVHLGTHDAVARAVQNGQVPAGGLSKAILDNLTSRGTVDKSKIIEIGLSDPIPNYPMVMQGNLAPELKARIREAFIGLQDPEILKAFRVQGFAATDDKAYDVLRDTAKVLDLDLTKVRG